jgi:hypothetical protein
MLMVVVSADIDAANRATGIKGLNDRVQVPRLSR